jgi:hypothetical protein
MLPVLTTLSAYSQNSRKDSITCIPNSQLRTALRLIEKGRFSEEQLQIANSNLAIMESRILNKDSVIQKFDSLENNYKALVANAESRVKNAEEKSKLDLEWVNKLNNDLRKQKRKTTFAWVIGGVATAAAIFVFAR